MRRQYSFIAALSLISLYFACTSASAQTRALGLDVSAWQGNLTQSNWNSIAGAGKSFAFIRSSRGGTTGFYNQSDSDNSNFLNTFSQRYDDPNFANSISRATNAGMLAGSYHFGRMDIISYDMDGVAVAQTGTDEANHMLQMAGAYMRPGYLLPIFDFEAGSGIQSAEQLAQFSIAFSNRIQAATGIQPGVYIGGNYANPMNSIPSSNALVAGYPVTWNANWPASPNITTGNPSSTTYGPWDNFGDSNPWHFWQYTSTGTVAGISGNVDLDVSHGTIEYVKDHLVPVLWMNDTSGSWGKISNWNSDNRDYNAADVTKGPAPRLPGTLSAGNNDTVILSRPNANITVTIDKGTEFGVRKLFVGETLNIAGGRLVVNYDPTTVDAVGNVGSNIRGSWVPAPWATGVSAQFSAPVTLTNHGQMEVLKLQVDAGQTFTINDGVLSFNTINLMPSSGTPAKLVLSGDLAIGTLVVAQGNNFSSITNGSGGGTSGSVDLGNGVRKIMNIDGLAVTDLLISVPVAGSGGGINKIGTGQMALTAANTFTGPLIVSEGSVALSGSGTANTASGYSVYGRATLQLDNSGTNNSNRLGTAAITLNGGTLGFVGNTTTESIGNLSATAGAATVALSGTGTSTLAAGSYSRSSGATVNFTGADSTHRATFTSGVTPDNFIDQGTFVNGADFAVYNTGTNYVRAMVAGAGASDYATAVTFDRHVKLSASASNVGGTTIKTLNLAGATVGLDLQAGNTLTLTNGGVIKSGGGLGSITGSGAALASGAEYVFNPVSASDELAVAVAVKGGTGLTKTGAGTLTLSNTGNNYSGATSVTQGTLKLGASNVIPDGSDIVVGTGATLNLNSQSETVGNITIYDGTIGSAGTLTLSGANPTVTYNGVGSGEAAIQNTNLVLGTSAGTTTFDVADARLPLDLIIGSVIQDGAGSQGLTKTGAGTLWLGSDNSFTGPLNIAAGTVFVTSINATATASQPLGNSNSTITLGSASAAALEYESNIGTTLNRTISIGGAGGGTIRTTASFGTLTIGSGGINGNGNGVTFDPAAANITVNGVISGAGTTVTKIGAQTLTLSASNSYTGNTIINEGILAYSAAGNLGTGNAILFGGGTLRTTAALTEARGVTLNAAGGTIDSNGFGSTFSGVFSGIGGLTKIGTGTLTLSNANTYIGTTNINAGTLSLTGSTVAASEMDINSGGTLMGTGSVLGKAQVLGTGIINMSGAGSIAGTLTAHGGSWNGAGSVGGVVNVVGGTFTVGSGANLTATSGVTVDGGALAGTGTITGNVTLANNPVNYATINLSGAGNITGTLGVAGGTSIWSGTGSVAGLTTVSSGTLYVNGTMGGAGGLTLASGANLHGIGTINKTITLTGNNRLGGRIQASAAGASSPTIGTLTINSAVVWGASNLFIEGGPVATTGDTISGSLTIESPSDLQHGYDLNYSVSLGGSGTAAITTTGILAGNGRVTKPVTITGNGIINLSSPPTVPASGSTLTSTLTATGGKWNGQGTVSGLTSVTSGTFTIGSGANLTANGNVTVSGAGALGGTGTITGSVTYTSSAADIFAGVIAGSSKTLTVNSAAGGVLTLTGTNSYTGATTITAGTLQLGNGGTTGSIADTGGIVDNSLLIFNRSNAYTYGGIISGSGAVTKLGASTVTYTGANTYAGGTTISAGTLQIGNGGTTGSLSNAGGIANNSAIIFNRSDAYTYGGAINGSGTVTKSAAGTLTFTGANSYLGLTTISAGTLQIGNGGTTGSLADTGGIVDNSALIFNRSDAYTYGGAISGSGTMTKSGAGTFTLAGTNSYAGSTTINSGVLEYTTNANLGSASNSIIFGGGTLRTLAAGTQSRNVTLNGTGAIDTNGFDSTFNGSFTGTGGLAKLGTGTLTLSGSSNTFGGPVTINDGIVKVTGNNQLGTSGVATNMTVVAPGSAGSGHGGTLQLSGNVGYDLPLTIGGGGLNGVSLTVPGSVGALDNSSGDNTWSGAVTLAGTGGSGTDPLENQIGAQAGVLRLTGVVQNAVSVNATWAKTGDGDVVLGGAAANTYGGLTRVFGGRLILEKDGALGTAGSDSDTTGNTFELANSSSTVAFRAPATSSGFDYNTFEVINTQGMGAPGFGQVDNLAGDNTFDGHIAFDGPTVSGARRGTIGVTSGSLNITGGVYARGSDGTPRELTKLGSGTLILSGDGGTATANPLVAPLASSTFNVNAGTVEMRGPSLATANLPGVTTWNVVAGSTLRASTGRFSTGNVNVGAGGQFDLTGGSTDLATLDLSGGGSFGFAGGTLHAQTIQGNVVNQGGALSPGSSPGSTSVLGDYTQQMGGTLDIEIGGTTVGTDFDVVSVTGNAVLGGTLDVSLINGFTPTFGQQFTVLTAGSVSNNGLTLGGAAAGLFNLLIGPSSVTLQAILQGDFNHDDVVDAADYVVWRKGSGTTYFPIDYDAWRAHYGEPSGSSASLPRGGAVPEPAAVALLICGTLLVAFGQRVRRLA